MKNIAVDQLANEISKTLKAFEGATDEAVKSGVLDTAEEAVKELRAANPQGSGDYSSWKDYNRGWGIKASVRGKKTEATVHNKTKYRLTHLLEKGHAKVNGGRTRAFPHIAPVADKCEKWLVENVKKRVENG